MTFAQFVGKGSTGIIGVINTIVVPTIIALVFLMFIWGVMQYFFFGSGDAKKHEQGRYFVLWSVLALVLLFSVWGVVNILLSTLGIAGGR